MAYASRNLPPMNVGASSSSNPYNYNLDSSSQFHSSRALPASFYDSTSAGGYQNQDKRSAQRYEQPLGPLTNPNQIKRVDGRYFPSMPRSSSRPRGLEEERELEEEARRNSGFSNYSSNRGSEQYASSEHAYQAGGEDERMDLDGEDDKNKKRSRTLTTAYQTQILQNLLAKTRFPSTETREEVGQQIGMSSRRVQIWFQNRRQSQKRARDRESTETSAPNYFSNSPVDNSAPLLPIKDERSWNLSSASSTSAREYFTDNLSRPSSFRSGSTTVPTNGFITRTKNEDTHMNGSSQPYSTATQGERQEPFSSRPRQVSVSSIGSYNSVQLQEVTGTLMTLPESPQSFTSSNSGWKDSLRTNSNSSSNLTMRRVDMSHQHAFYPTSNTIPQEKFEFPRINGRDRISSISSSGAESFLSDSSKSRQDSLLNNSLHSRSSSNTSLAYSDFQKGKMDSRNGGGFLPPIGDLLEFGTGSLSWNSHLKTGNYGMTCTPTNSGRPPPAPSTGARVNNYHHHPHPHTFNPSSQPSAPHDFDSTPMASRSNSYSDGLNTGGPMIPETLPKLDELRISGNYRNSVLSNRSSVYSSNTPSSRNSFYSFGSTDESTESDSIPSIHSKNNRDRKLTDHREIKGQEEQIEEDGLDFAMHLMTKDHGGRVPIHLAPILSNSNSNPPVSQHSNNSHSGSGTSFFSSFGGGSEKRRKLPSLSMMVTGSSGSGNENLVGLGVGR